MSLEDHAFVKLAEFPNPIPLIGINPTATEMECECCHNIFHISEVQLNEAGNQFLCIKCRTSVEYPSG